MLKDIAKLIHISGSQETKTENHQALFNFLLVHEHGIKRWAHESTPKEVKRYIEALKLNGPQQTIPAARRGLPVYAVKIHWSSKES